jgi:hypothetical protein
MPNFSQIVSEMEILAHFSISKQANNQGNKKGRKKAMCILAKFQPNPFKNNDFSPIRQIDQPTVQPTTFHSRYSLNPSFFWGHLELPCQISAKSVQKWRF